MNFNHFKTLICVLCLFLLAACSSTQSVNNLAERTAANAGIISAQLNMLAQDSSQLADLRAANIAQLHASNTALRASYNYDLALTKKSGGQANLNLIDDLEEWHEKVNDIFEAADNAEEERKKAILDTQTKLVTKSEALTEIAQSLAALAKEESSVQRAIFLAGFARQLQTEIDKQLEQSNESSTLAKKLLGELKE